MIRVEASVMVNQPIEKVFEFVTKPENDAQWFFGADSRDHTPGEPAGVGSTSQSEFRFLGVGLTVEWEVTEYNAPSMIKVKTIKGPVSIEAGYTLEAVTEEQTKVTVAGEADLRGVFDLAEPLVERMAQRQWETGLENLKDVLEA